MQGLQGHAATQAWRDCPASYCCAWAVAHVRYDQELLRFRGCCSWTLSRMLERSQPRRRQYPALPEP